jgi:hypothetical protein
MMHNAVYAGVIQEFTGKYVAAAKSFPKTAGDNGSKPLGNVELSWQLQEEAGPIKDWQLNWTYPAGNEKLTMAHADHTASITARRSRWVVCCMPSDWLISL